MSDDRARVVIVGGGVAGTSIAYHLTKMGWSDVLLIDRSELTSGSTFHSAGLIAQLRNSVSHTRMMMYGVELYRRLAEETGVDPAWHEVGSLRLASSTERIEELRRLAGWGQTFGPPLEIVSTDRALELWPLFDPEGVRGILDLGLGIEQLERHAQRYEHLLERPDGGADDLQWLVDQSQIGHDYQKLPRSELALQRLKRTKADH